MACRVRSTLSFPTTTHFFLSDTTTPAAISIAPHHLGKQALQRFHVVSRVSALAMHPRNRLS